MTIIFYAAAVYMVLLLTLKLSGRRTLAQLSTFDFVLLLIIGGSVRQALLGSDYSLTRAIIAVSTLIGLDVLLNFIKRKWSRVGRWIEGQPLILVENGKPIQDRLKMSRVSEEEILAAARAKRGIGTMEQIRYAILESSGGISIIE